MNSVADLDNARSASFCICVLGGRADLARRWIMVRGIASSWQTISLYPATTAATRFVLPQLQYRLHLFPSLALQLCPVLLTLISRLVLVQVVVVPLKRRLATPSISKITYNGLKDGSFCGARARWVSPKVEIVILRFRPGSCATFRYKAECLEFPKWFLRSKSIH